MNLQNPVIQKVPMIRTNPGKLEAERDVEVMCEFMKMNVEDIVNLKDKLVCATTTWRRSRSKGFGFVTYRSCYKANNVIELGALDGVQTRSKSSTYEKKSGVTDLKNAKKRKLLDDYSISSPFSTRRLKRRRRLC